MARAYDELVKLAAWALAHHPVREPLIATDVIHDAYARLSRREPIDAPDHRRFYALWAKAMRSVLVDRQRRENALKRRPQEATPPATFRIDDEEILLGILDLDAALCDLDRQSADARMVVEQLFFAGRSMRQTAEALDMSLTAVKEHWHYARSWLARWWRERTPAQR